MKTTFYLLKKYWRRHLKSAFWVLFAGVLVSAILFAEFMSVREQVARRYHQTYDAGGNCDVLVANSNDELLEKIVQDRSGYYYGYINVYGTLSKDGQSYLYGTIYDEHNVYHLPIEEGRLPENADEIAVPRVLLDKWSWAGKCGDNITIDDRTFTVVGIIDKIIEQRSDFELTNANLPAYPKDSPYKVPALFVGENGAEPQFRIDMLGYLFTKEERTSPDQTYPAIREFGSYLNTLIPQDADCWWTSAGSRTYYDGGTGQISQPADFFMIIAYIGTAVSALSVFVVLRNVFAERRAQIEMLKKIGMKKSAIGQMYAVECGAFFVIQTVLGYILGSAAYWGIFLFKTNVLGEQPYSAVTDIKQVYDKSREPFLYTALLSAAVMILGYVINIIIIKISARNRAKLKQARKPRSLAGTLRRVFRQSGVTFIQTIALTLICFAVLIGLAFYSDEGKTTFIYLINSLEVNGMDMERNNIAEYYTCSHPITSAVGDGETLLRFVDTNYTVGIGDDIAEQLPDCTISSGYLEQTFVVSDEEKYLPKDLFDTTDDNYRNVVLNFSDKENQNFFDEGQVGSKYLYQAKTKLLDSRTIATLSEYVKSGSINVDALNRGEEILVVYRQGVLIPKYEVGETLTVGSISTSESGYGVGGVVTSDVKVGAVLRIPDETSDLIKEITGEPTHNNLLTTATGAEKLGLHCARYTDIYSSEPIDGGIFPSSAEMKLTSLAALKREKYIKKAIQYGGTTMILLVMSLLGFSAYFNGIGMKIRLKSYDISVLRAIGTPVSALRRKLILSSIKIPLIASSVAYGLARLVQFIMLDAQHRYDALLDKLFLNPVTGVYEYTSTVGVEPLPEEYTLKSLQQNYFLDYCMWEVKLEIPALILFAVLCAVTFILTAMALKKFRRDIAFDLSSGRTRQ